MNVNAIIDGILQREGQGVPPYTAPNDAGGRTSWGISERAHPEAWRFGPPSRDVARAIYLNVYLKPFFALQSAASDALITALVDEGVMSGTAVAIKRLQHVLGLDADGIIGKDTVAAVKVYNSNRLLQRYTIDRTIALTRIVEQHPSDLSNLTGWVSRALAFLPTV